VDERVGLAFGFHEGPAPMKHRRLTFMWLCSALLLTTATPTHADDGPAPAAADEADPQRTTHTPVSQNTDYEEIVVTSPHSRRRFDVVQGTSVLSNEELERSIQSTLGETLARLPGVTSSYFGPGASRPVIRGLDGPRIRVLSNGLGTLDASVTSPDHAVAADPLAAHRIEVIRGAGTLLYGSSAIGGVVNVDDGRIPDMAPGDEDREEVMEGEVRGLYGSASDEKSGAAGLTGRAGPFALRASGFFRATGDVQIPGTPVSDRLAAARPDIDRGPDGTAPNTSVDSLGGTLGASWVGESASLGAAFGVNDSDYGVPSEPGEEIRIELLQHRVDLHGRVERDLLAFDEASFRFAYADYEHDEIEGGVQGTRFENEGYEGRLDLSQRPWNELHGSLGFQFLKRDFSAIGDEAFTPPSETFQWGLFAVEEYHLGDVTFEAGLRFERQTIEATSVGFARDFNMVSASAGASWAIWRDYMLGLSLSYTERPPSAEELLSDGPHLATASFEVGDPTLDKESGFTIEWTARKRAGRASGGFNVYYTRFDDFINARNSGFVDEDGNPDPMGELMLRRYEQGGADFVGAELQAALEVFEVEQATGVVDLVFDWVRATGRSSGEPLSRIPPLRVRGGLEGRSELADIRLDLSWVDEQTRVAPGELPTSSYFMLDATLTLHPFTDRRDVTIIVQGANLTNAEARVHSSFLKDRLPLPGRGVRVGLRVAY